MTPIIIYVDGGYANFAGKTIDVLGTTQLDNSGFITTNMTNHFQTSQMIASLGYLLVKNGSKVIIKSY